MENNEVLKLILEKVTGMEENISLVKSDIQNLKEDMTLMKADIQELKEDMTLMKTDVQGLKEDMKSVKREVTEINERTIVLEDNLGKVILGINEIKEDVDYKIDVLNENNHLAGIEIIKLKREVKKLS